MHEDSGHRLRPLVTTVDRELPQHRIVELQTDIERLPGELTRREHGPSEPVVECPGFSRDAYPTGRNTGFEVVVAIMHEGLYGPGKRSRRAEQP